jgi:hypothetical protein
MPRVVRSVIATKLRMSHPADALMGLNPTVLIFQEDVAEKQR